MFEVIVSTINTGRVQRKYFEELAKAEEHADKYRQKCSVKGNKSYHVELSFKEMPMVRQLPQPAKLKRKISVAA